MTDTIPVAYIESEKIRLTEMVWEAVRNENADRALQLTSSISTLEALITNWKYTTGPDWRETHND